MTDDEPVQSDNRLLSSLSEIDMTRLRPSIRRVSLECGQLLNQPGEPIEHVYFPHGGMVALMVTMKDGRAVNTAIISREGAVGAMAGLGVDFTTTRAVVQIESCASRIAVAAFRAVVEASPALRNRLVHYNEVLLGQVQITAGCNALHRIDARLARWILEARDRIDGDRIPLTQELISEMLGVRRSSISEIAGKIRADGLIHYGRGAITIINRVQLEAVACECYALAKARSDLLLRWVTPI